MVGPFFYKASLRQVACSFSKLHKFTFLLEINAPENRCSINCLFFAPINWTASDCWGFNKEGWSHEANNRTCSLVLAVLANGSLFLPLAMEGVQAETVPDIRGTWTYGPSSFLRTGCQNPLDNTFFNDLGGGTFRITNQTKANFSFNTVESETDGGDTIQETDTYTGTIAPDGTVDFSGNYVGTLNGVF